MCVENGEGVFYVTKEEQRKIDLKCHFSPDDFLKIVENYWDYLIKKDISVYPDNVIYF